MREVRCNGRARLERQTWQALLGGAGSDDDQVGADVDNLPGGAAERQRDRSRSAKRVDAMIDPSVTLYWRN